MVNHCVQGIVAELCFIPTLFSDSSTKYSLRRGGFVNRYGNLKKYVVNIKIISDLNLLLERRALMLSSTTRWCVLDITREER